MSFLWVAEGSSINYHLFIYLEIPPLVLQVLLSTAVITLVCAGLSRL